MKKWCSLILMMFLCFLSTVWADDLEIYGSGSISVEPNILIIFDCSGSMGTNDQNGQSRMSVAKQAVTDLITNTNNVRFGLMKFTNCGSISLVAQCGATKAALLSAVTNFSPQSMTPLEESLYKAGQYFLGRLGYPSPIQLRCQKNYVVLMTDGQPTCGLYNSKRLDQHSQDLFNTDCRTDLPDLQNVKTYTIGFSQGASGGAALLQSTATNGGGLFYSATNSAALTQAFQSIISSIQTDAKGVFAAPVIPVSNLNSSFSGGWAYLSFFQPQADGRWFGNLKKYKVNTQGELIDASNNKATDVDGLIKKDALSFWTTGGNDGNSVDKGGAGQKLYDQFNNPSKGRKIYTYMKSQLMLRNTDNAFATTNAKIKAAPYNLTDDLINDVRGLNRKWIFGDIVHSDPAVVHYSVNDSAIFVGGNDGMLHCIDDATGEELWAFIPPSQLSRLNLLSNGTHNYFVDGPPVIYSDKNSNSKFIIFGERRGGDSYYTIDISDKNNPIWKYEIAPNKLGGGSATLGQSWCKPTIHKIKNGGNEENVFLMGGGYDENQDLPTPNSSDTVGRSVFAVRVSDGALTSLNFNPSNVAAMTNCIVDVAGFDHDGDGITSRVYAGDLGGNLFAFKDDDDNNNGQTDGNWEKKKLFSAPSQRKIFYAPDAVAEKFTLANGTKVQGEYIFFGTGDREHPLDKVITNTLYAIKNDWSFDNLTESTVLRDQSGSIVYDLQGNQIMALVDVTANLIQDGTDAQKANEQYKLDKAKGWYIRLEGTGEKLSAPPVVYGGVVYFTTHTPDAGGGAVDPCVVKLDRGTAKIYALNYKNGGSVHNYSTSNDTNLSGKPNVNDISNLPQNPAKGTIYKVNSTGKYYEFDGTSWKEVTGEVLGKIDRNKTIGTGIPSGPGIAILPGGARIFVGVEGGAQAQDPITLPELNIFYWRQI
ncbi:MAG: VWA domain-containing protein [Desulfobacterales bacterium]|nr:VWA domain-containing protein [Desulfobacterales bacterium]